MYRVNSSRVSCTERCEQCLGKYNTVARGISLSPVEKQPLQFFKALSGQRHRVDDIRPEIIIHANASLFAYAFLSHKFQRTHYAVEQRHDGFGLPFPIALKKLQPDWRWVVSDA